MTEQPEISVTKTYSLTMAHIAKVSDLAQQIEIEFLPVRVNGELFLVSIHRLAEFIFAFGVDAHPTDLGVFIPFCRR